jgi:radical SAM superfamily enzyme YgiQ (UPF0313 family)
MPAAAQTLPNARRDTVLLVSCYELGHEPLGLVGPAGVLARAGIRPRVLDLAVEAVDDAALRDADVIAVSTPMHTALRLGARLAAHVRAVNPRAHVVFYGLYAGLHADHLVPRLADTCLGAEYEAPLLDLVTRVLESPDREPRSIAPPAANRVRSPGRAHDLSPARDIIVHRDHYARLAIGEERREVGYVATTRGCKHLCTHCPLPPVYAGRFYAIAPERVNADLDAVVARGARHITFADADFLNGPGQALRVARDLHARHPGVTFDFTAKIEHLRRHARAVRELRDLGAVFVVSAVESMNDAVLAHLRKGHTRDDAIAVIRDLRRIDLALRPSLVPFTPWETRDSLALLLDVVQSEGLAESIDAVQYSIRLLVPEGSLLLDDASMRTHLGAFDPERFTYRWTHPDPAMDGLQVQLAGVAEDAARTEDPAVVAFDRVRDAVMPGRAGRTRPSPAGPPPRLTEDWFC